MLKKLLRKTNVAKEYMGEVKITYINKTLVILNYKELISINNILVDLKEFLIKGEGLKVVYQDPIRLKVNGKISEVIKK